jgi:hypothetical protein
MTLMLPLVNDTAVSDDIVVRRCRNEEEPAAAISYTQKQVLKGALVVNNQIQCRR